MTRVLALLKEPERSAMRFERLADDCPGIGMQVTSAAKDARDAEVLITIGTHLGPAADVLYRSMPSLAWVQSFGTGTDNIKGHPALARHVAITNVHGVHGPQLSEAAFAAMLGFARSIPQALRNQSAARWEKPPVTLLAGKTVVILGLGAIARDLAPRCEVFGMHVLGVSGTARAEPGFERVYRREALAEASAHADFLIVLTPHSAATDKIVGAGVFAAMKPGAVLVNLARGGVVDEAALLIALDTGEIAGAALDVFATEPLPEKSPFWRHPRVIVTPHAAGFHDGYGEQAYAVIVANLRRYLTGGVDALVNRV